MALSINLSHALGQVAQAHARRLSAEHQVRVHVGKARPRAGRFPATDFEAILEGPLSSIAPAFEDLLSKLCDESGNKLATHTHVLPAKVANMLEQSDGKVINDIFLNTGATVRILRRKAKHDRGRSSSQSADKGSQAAAEPPADVKAIISGPRDCVELAHRVVKLLGFGRLTFNGALAAAVSEIQDSATPIVTPSPYFERAEYMHAQEPWMQRAFEAQTRRREWQAAVEEEARASLGLVTAAGDATWPAEGEEPRELRPAATSGTSGTASQEPRQGPPAAQPKAALESAKVRSGISFASAAGKHSTPADEQAAKSASGAATAASGAKVKASGTSSGRSGDRRRGSEKSSTHGTGSGSSDKGRSAPQGEARGQGRHRGDRPKKGGKRSGGGAANRGAGEQRPKQQGGQSSKSAGTGQGGAGGQQKRGDKRGGAKKPRGAKRGGQSSGRAK